MNTVSPEMLHDWLGQPAELAVLDVREAGEFGLGHLLFAVPAPYSRFEFDLDQLVPLRATRLVLCDDGRSRVAERAAWRANALGYERVYVLEGGTEGWERAGYRLFAGVNVPSKVFGELVEETHHTPRIGASDLHAMLERGERVVVVDGRPFAEYRKMNIPGSLCCPNGELPLRISAIVENEAIPIVVNCAGRTRSIIGAQTLLELGIRNPVFALENGTQGWTLAGFELERGSARRYPSAPPQTDLTERARVSAELAARQGVRSLDPGEARQWLADPARTTYLLDVRTPEEFETEAVPGARNAPGGQLVQATDQWLAVRGARVLLLDHDGIRAPIVARWLRRMGWDAHTVRVPVGTVIADRAVGSAVASTLPLPVPVTHDVLDEWRQSGDCLVLDVRPSMEFRRGHIPGSTWSIRPRIARDVPAGAKRIALVSDDLLVLRLVARELAERKDVALRYLDGGYRRWVAEGRPTEASPEVPTDRDAIDYLFFVHDRHEGNLEAARQYLAWEQGLVALLEPEERARFKP
ncbi:MAG: rhodanese-like domain-containing protein [Burkholderiaceae bacterium]|nr:rhodanese-like domain-containing protein [Burkholderiaceae bacterium]